MSFTIFLYCIAIVVSRVLDVSLGVLRTVCIFRNLKGAAAMIGFFEALFWTLAAAKFTTNLDVPAYIVAYALGFSLGTFVGLKIENRLAIGNQVLRVFTRSSAEILPVLRGNGLRVTKFAGEGQSGAVDLLMLKLPRKGVSKITDTIKKLDPSSFYFIDDIGASSDAIPMKSIVPSLGFRAQRK